MVKNLPAMQENWVQSMDQEDPLEKGMATHSSILTWKIPWTEEPGRLQFTGLQKVRHGLVTNTFTYVHSLLLLKWSIATISYVWTIEKLLPSKEDSLKKEGKKNNFRVEKDKHYLESDDQGQYQQ